MAIVLKKISILSLLFLTVLLSCRKEEIESIQTPKEDTLEANSNIARLMQLTASNDGSNDNIIDASNCFNIQLPVTVFANGQEITVNTEDDYNVIEAVFDEFDDDIDTIDIQFPITIILEDFSSVLINNMTELNTYSSNCNGENVSDDDIECIDFQYPISASIFNANSELISTSTFSNDYELYEFIHNIHPDDIVSITFPITIILFDGTQLTINNLSDLESTIETYQNSCDEDDDYDYNDDDCNNCTSNQITDVLTNCPDWYVDKLEYEGRDYDDLYDGYLFNFFTDGTLSVDHTGTTDYGTWSTSGSGNNITVVINIPSLPYCNNNWNLHEIEQSPGESKVDLRLGDDDRLRYKGNCN